MVINRARSSIRSCSSSNARVSMSDLSRGEVAAKAGCAATAASSAARPSEGDASATAHSVLPVAGSTTLKVRPSAASIHLPSMKSRFSTASTTPASRCWFTATLSAGPRSVRYSDCQQSTRRQARGETVMHRPLLTRWPVEQATDFALAQLDYVLQTLSAPRRHRGVLHRAGAGRRRLRACQRAVPRRPTRARRRARHPAGDGRGADRFRSDRKVLGP